ncbi:hypothetical protein BG011_001318 [Mortierella polycephala]|uniref:Uncharacterized protein n=1 Tax=Mortierella polycephala TaxID=41804 RepID=A0A9P6TUV4_9FUNG|nr:hypothetical protein BG011_001318 [Mortierella polycephala]
MSLLKDSQDQEENRAYKRLSRIDRNERLAIFKDVISNMGHVNAIKPYAAMEKVAVARWQAEDISDELQSLSETNLKKKRTSRNLEQTASDTKKRTLQNSVQPATDVKARSLQDILDQFNRVTTQEPKPSPWTLSSGTVVDEKLICYAQSLKGEEAVHSFIFDTSNRAIMRLFTLEEQQEILMGKGARMTNDRHLSQYLATFACTTIEQLRLRLETNDSSKLDGFYGDDRHRLLEGRRWIYKTMLGMADLIEGRSINGYGSEAQSERWCELHIWKMLDEYAMNNKTIQLMRGENTSSASSFRKNSFSRTAGERKKMGRRVDGIFRATFDRIEIGGIELGSQDEHDNGSKFVGDGLKLQKLLKDQFDYALSVKPHIKKQNIEMLGLQLLSRSMQVISLDWADGLFLRFKREDRTVLPFDMERFRDLLIGMAKIMLFFDRMADNITELNPTRTTSAFDDIFDPPRTPPPLSQEPPTATSP